jgi:hypothetical protein
LEIMEQNHEAYNLEYLGIWNHIMIMGWICGLSIFWILDYLPRGKHVEMCINLTSSNWCIYCMYVGGKGQCTKNTKNNRCNNKTYPAQIHVMKCVSITCHFYISDMFAISCEEINNTYDTSLCCKVNGWNILEFVAWREFGFVEIKVNN